MNREQVLGFVRHFLTFGGGLIVAKGYTDESTMVQMVGALITLIGGVWSIMSPEKKKPVS